MWLLGSLKNLAYTEDAIVSVSYYCSVLIRTGGTHKQLEEVMKCYLAPYIMMQGAIKFYYALGGIIQVSC